MYNLVINSYPQDLIYSVITDGMGTKTITICLSQTVIDTVNWVAQQKIKSDIEEEVRRNNPVLQELYESYTTALKLLQN